jgi:hypothetical protein
MSRLSVWLPPEGRGDLRSQRYVITRLLNAGILADDIAVSLRQTAHVLAAVADAERLDDIE